MNQSLLARFCGPRGPDIGPVMTSQPVMTGRFWPVTKFDRSYSLQDIWPAAGQISCAKTKICIIRRTIPNVDDSLSKKVQVYQQIVYLRSNLFKIKQNFRQRFNRCAYATYFVENNLGQNFLKMIHKFTLIHSLLTRTAAIKAHGIFW